jgi:hypothetical protein
LCTTVESLEETADGSGGPGLRSAELSTGGVVIHKLILGERGHVERLERSVGRGRFRDTAGASRDRGALTGRVFQR